MHLQLPGERADRPVLGMMEPQDLRLELARDHPENPEAARSPPAPGPGADPRPPWQRRATERAALAQLGGFDGVIIAELPREDRGAQERAPRRATRGSLMRHFVARARPVRPLPRGVAMRAAMAALIAGAGAPRALPAPDPCAGPGAVHVAVIAGSAEAHLHGAARAVVEPIARLPEHPQCPSPKHWTARGEAGIKGLHIALPWALRVEGPGKTVNRVPGLRLSACRAEHSRAPPRHPSAKSHRTASTTERLLPPRCGGRPHWVSARNTNSETERSLAASISGKRKCPRHRQTCGHPQNDAGSDHRSHASLL